MKRRVIIAVVTVLLALAAAVVWQQLLANRARAARKMCLNNLQAIQSAKEAWSLEWKWRPPPGYVLKDSDLFGPDKYLPEKPKCPAGGTYTLGTEEEPPRCSIPGHTLNTTNLWLWSNKNKVSLPAVYQAAPAELPVSHAALGVLVLLRRVR